jgi:Cu(I)/Ag(I) efflux system membrane fusion protein
MLTRSCFFLLLISPVAAVAGDNLTPLFNAYHELQTALAGDDFQAAKSATSELQTAVSKVKVSQLASTIQPVWKQQSHHLSMALKQAGTANDLSGIRTPFEHISMAIIALSKVASPGGWQEYHCPMAFNNKGANWLQKGEKTANPYFGSSMLRCGAPVKAKHHKHNHDR